MNPGHRLGRPVEFNELWVRYKEQFAEALFAEVAESTAKDYLSALNRFFGAHKISTTEELRRAYITEGQKRNYGKALRKFFGFLYDHDVISGELYMKLKRIIKIKEANVRKLHILPPEEIREGYEYFKKYGRPEEVLLYKLLVLSGARLKHLVELLLNNYTPEKLTVLKDKGIAKYALFYHEGTKSMFYVYMPAELAGELFRSNYSYDMAKKYLRYGRLNASHIRTWFSDYLVELKVQPAVINYIQGGRVPKKVLDADYSLLERHADREYAEIVGGELKKVLEGDVFGSDSDCLD
ncbi:integrase [Thermococcus sp. JCM 11816]|uniref:integrase n=1 Tax=Thermococcus sp. (strain JCM 11816 / KS-1) TaxID=1295125 RepID=UPI0006CFB17D